MLRYLLMLLLLSACTTYAPAHDTVDAALDGEPVLTFPATAFQWFDADEVTEFGGFVTLDEGGGKGIITLNVPSGTQLQEATVYLIAANIEAGAYIKTRDIGQGPDVESEVNIGSAYETWPDTYTAARMVLDHAVVAELAYSIEVWCLGPCTVGGVQVRYALAEQ
jgi:hypothetical protein